MKLNPRWAFPLAVALGAFALIGGTGLTVSSAWLITMASQHPPVLVLSVAIVMVRFFGIFRSVARYAERVISHEAIFRKLTGMRVRLFDVVSGKLRSIDVSRQSKAIIDDVERAQEFHLRVTLPGLSALVAGTFTVLIAAWIDFALLTWILPATAAFAIVIPVSVRKYLDPVSVEIEELESAYAVEVSSASFALVEAEVFGYADKYRSDLSTRAVEIKQAERRYFRRTSILQGLFIATLGTTLVGISVTLRGGSELLPVQISMALFLALVGFEGFTSWFPNLFPAGKNRRAAKTIEEISQTTPTLDTFKKPLSHLISAKNFSPYWNEVFLPHISFELNPGETLVIQGASGVGKSTLAAALFGFAPYEGTLTIGDAEIANIDSVASYVTGTLQSGHIFNTTVRENLKISQPDASDAELLEILSALELASLSLDEVIGEFGRHISGGEAKRISIARALLATAPIVILDEPLEHLDPELGLRLQEAIARWCAGKTLIVITHAPWLQYSKKLELTRE
jgi:thiol reductant ABC exporter CydC subunit